DDKNIHLDPVQGMGPLPDNKPVTESNKTPTHRIGYIHGMTIAMLESVRVGPWCTPYELALGEKTIKMASCFACSTYMYGNGFTPSSIHLGKAESWVPPAANLDRAEKSKMPYFDEDIARSMHTRWKFDIFRYMQMGIKYLANAVAVRESRGKE